MQKIILLLFATISCSSSREKIFKIGVQEGWVDATHYTVLALSSQEYNGEAAKFASQTACAFAEAKISQRFSEIILGDKVEDCAKVDPSTDSRCDWVYRLDPHVFTFRGKEFKRQHYFTSKKVICEIAYTYYHPSLRHKMEEYAARFNLTLHAP
ncbi:MAG: hypothetical protein LDLANPLL_01541 [Turneriella sp.]|mgnify:CR=1 FL=1|nr:hypothetical protein [Turneriella sp.]